MAVIIPVKEENTAQEIEVVLDGIPYNTKFVYNERYDYWTFSLLTLEGVQIFDSIRLEIGYPLTQQFPNELAPLGEFVVIDTTEKETHVNFENFGKIVELIYLSEDEVDAV